MDNFSKWFSLNESKQEIISLGFPGIIAKLFFKNFGKHANLLAKWFRQYHYNTEDNKSWWRLRFGGWNQNLTLSNLVDYYNSTFNEEDFLKVRASLGFEGEPKKSREEIRDTLLKEIERRFLDDIFFRYFSLVEDIVSGKLKNVAPYKNLSFMEAQEKYDNKKVFEDIKPLKVYNNGYKWIDVGRTCVTLGDKMKNCGNVGLMSMDEEATIIALFDAEQNPHVMVTYSPKENVISGDEGIASTPIKKEYHKYVLDLIKILGADFKAFKSRSNLLKVKYYLQGKASNIRQLSPNRNLYSFTVNGETYYTDSYEVISKKEMDRAKEAIENGDLYIRSKQAGIGMFFNHRNTPYLKDYGIEYMSLEKL